MKTPNVRPIRKWSIACCLAAWIVSGCSADSTVSTADSIVGSFTLRTINGAALPFANSDASVIYTAGTVIFTATMTYEYSSSVTIANEGPSMTGGSGAYSLSGNTVMLVQSDGSTGAMTFSDGNTLTLVSAGYTFVYRK